MISPNEPAVRYQLTVHESVFDMVHGHGTKITEVFIPSHNVAFNSEGYMFKCDKPRNVQHLKINPLTDILLPKELVEKIARIAETKLKVAQEEKELNEVVKSFF